jgi:hypothetical protein
LNNLPSCCAAFSRVRITFKKSRTKRENEQTHTTRQAQAAAAAKNKATTVSQPLKRAKRKSNSGKIKFDLEISTIRECVLDGLAGEKGRE